MEELLHKELTEVIINAFYKVYNHLGYGFLEKVYENALMYELKSKGLFVEKQKPINVYYQQVLVGEFYADLEVNETIILELKASSELVYENEVQLMNYLKATEIEVGLLFNFGKKPEFRRKVFMNKQK